MTNISPNSQTIIEVKDGQLSVRSSETFDTIFVLFDLAAYSLRTQGKPDGMLEIPTPEQVGILLNTNGEGQ